MAKLYLPQVLKERNKLSLRIVHVKMYRSTQSRNCKNIYILLFVLSLNKLIFVAQKNCN